MRTGERTPASGHLDPRDPGVAVLVHRVCSSRLMDGALLAVSRDPSKRRIDLVFGIEEVDRQPQVSFATDG